MKNHALFDIFDKAAKFKIVICCKLKVALKGLTEQGIIWATARENLSLGFETWKGSYRPAQLQRIAILLTVCLYFPRLHGCSAIQ